MSGYGEAAPGEGGSGCCSEADIIRGGVKGTERAAALVVDSAGGDAAGDEILADISALKDLAAGIYADSAADRGTVEDAGGAPDAGALGGSDGSAGGNAVEDAAAADAAVSPDGGASADEGCLGMNAAGDVGVVVDDCIWADAAAVAKGDVPADIYRREDLGSGREGAV